MGANWDKKTTTSKIGLEHKTPVTDESYLHIEPVYCSVFGCGKLLTLMEKLLGRKCSECQNKKNDVYFNGLL